MINGVNYLLYIIYIMRQMEVKAIPAPINIITVNQSLTSFCKQLCITLWDKNVFVVLSKLTTLRLFLVVKNNFNFFYERRKKC